jgi:AcrR family transcriptional regulator
MTDEFPTAPRRRPKQRRSQELVRSIQQACRKILEEQGPDKLTTHRIAQVAGVNIGSLYQYFPNKEAVVAEVYNAMLAAQAETVLAVSQEIDQMASRSIEETLRRIIDLEIGFHRRLLHLNAEFYRKHYRDFDFHKQIDPRLVAHQQPSWDEWFPTLLVRHQTTVRANDLPLASFIATRALDGVLHYAVEERPELLDSEAFREELLTLMLRFLKA